MLNSPVGVVTDLDGTVVFGGVADPRLAPFLRRAAGYENISIIVTTVPRNDNKPVIPIHRHSSKANSCSVRR